MNEFVEVVLGSMIVIPLAAGFFGVEWLKDNAGFGMAFRTMPFLLNNGEIYSQLSRVLCGLVYYFCGNYFFIGNGHTMDGFLA